jgi:hypothetical protein
MTRKWYDTREQQQWYDSHGREFKRFTSGISKHGRDKRGIKTLPIQGNCQPVIDKKDWRSESGILYLGC